MFSNLFLAAAMLLEPGQAQPIAEFAPAVQTRPMAGWDWFAFVGPVFSPEGVGPEIGFTGVGDRFGIDIEIGMVVVKDIVAPAFVPVSHWHATSWDKSGPAFHYGEEWDYTVSIKWGFHF